MPARFDSTVAYDSGRVFNELAPVGGNVPVYDTLLIFDDITPYDRQGGPMDQTDIYDNPNIFYNDGGVRPYNADRVYDVPSLFDYPPV